MVSTTIDVHRSIFEYVSAVSATLCVCVYNNSPATNSSANSATNTTNDTRRYIFFTLQKKMYQEELTYFNKPTL